MEIVVLNILNLDIDKIFIVAIVCLCVRVCVPLMPICIFNRQESVKARLCYLI